MENRIVAPYPDPFNPEDEELRLKRTTAPNLDELEADVRAQVDRIFHYLRSEGRTLSFHSVEKSVIGAVRTLGRLFLSYFLAWRHEYTEPDPEDYREGGFRVAQRQARRLGTHFGKIKYWRSYLRGSKEVGGGLYPLDLALGLTRDGFSRVVVSYAALLATILPFDLTTRVLLGFLSWSPSKSSVEKAVIGLGHHTEEFFEQCPAPEGDGSHLVIQIDSKATPTATEEELKKRRGKRKKQKLPKSPRHRARARRKLREPKKRRKKGDKSKNGKAATIVVMYTLKPHSGPSGRKWLLGPVNRRVYASYGSKRHAFKIARREADKRGFTDASGKLVQIVTDGENAFETNIKDLFPDAVHTIDFFHVMEYVWQAGASLFKEGSDELEKWALQKKRQLLDGEAEEVVQELQNRLESVPLDEPGTKGKRARLAEAAGYLGKRVSMMSYQTLREMDLEIASGIVEGAVNHVIAKRFDNGGMRWIRQRAQALLQLRCIHINGDWDAFIDFAYDRMFSKAREEMKAPVLLTQSAPALPDLGRAA